MGNPARIIACSLAALLVLLVLLSLTSCGKERKPQGSLQSQAAGAQARAENLTSSADKAAIEAADKEARADELARQAEQIPTAARIAAAADARVEAAAASAVSKALTDRADKATNAAEHAAAGARLEHEAELAAEDLRWWKNVCRAIGLGGVGVGVFLGGILGWLVTPRLGILVGVLIVGTGMACAAFGATMTWLPVALGGTVFFGLVVWALAHWRIGRVGEALSRSLDLAEIDHTTVPDATQLIATKNAAKAELARVVKASGLGKKFDRIRGKK